MSQTIEVDVNNLTGKFIDRHKSIRFERSANPLELDVNIKTIDLTKKVDSMFSSNLMLGLILYDNGEIIYERYRNPCSLSTPMFSWSMSKSLVGYTTVYGVPDLNKNISEYSKKLSKSLYANVSVKDVLTMSSGIVPDSYPFDVFWGFLYNILSTHEYITRTPCEITQKRFSYKDIDTHVLVNMLDEYTNFEETFRKKIWEPTNTESEGYWLIDKENVPIGSIGFSCTPRDWLRLAIHIMNEHNSNETIKAANSAQVYHMYPRINGKKFDHYGYQVWIDKSSFWWLGYGGQRIAIDPVQKKIMIVFSCSEYFMGKIYKLFEEFQKS